MRITKAGLLKSLLFPTAHKRVEPYLTTCLWARVVERMRQPRKVCLDGALLRSTLQNHLYNRKAFRYTMVFGS